MSTKHEDWLTVMNDASTPTCLQLHQYSRWARQINKTMPSMYPKVCLPLDETTNVPEQEDRGKPEQANSLFDGAHSNISLLVWSFFGKALNLLSKKSCFHFFQGRFHVFL